MFKFCDKVHSVKRKALQCMIFSLIELVVVVAIIFILAAILFPAFSVAKKKAQAIFCISNLKNIGNAGIMYTGDNNMYFPRVITVSTQPLWPTLLAADLKLRGPDEWPSPSVYLCPTANNQNPPKPYNGVYEFTYGANKFTDCAQAWARNTIREIKNPSGTVFFGDHSEDATAKVSVGNNQWWYSTSLTVSVYLYRIHGKKANFTFIDGHVASMNSSAVPILSNDVFWGGL